MRGGSPEGSTSLTPEMRIDRLGGSSEGEVVKTG